MNHYLVTILGYDEDKYGLQLVPVNYHDVWADSIEEVKQKYKHTSCTIQQIHE